MCRVLIASALLAFLSNGAVAGPKEDALAAYDKFFTSFVKGNDEQITGLFAPDAQFYGTGSTNLVTKPEGVRAYFKNALNGAAENKARPLENAALVLSDSVVVISGKWVSERMLDGKTTASAPLRNTVVMQKRGDRWLIVQFHNSPTPPAVKP
jgi:uncharacterized protein (TIGR02246 family)